MAIRASQPIVECDVGGFRPDAVTVDALARLQLAARRCGRRLRLRNASAELMELIAFMGLTEALGSRTTDPEVSRCRR